MILIRIITVIMMNNINIADHIIKIINGNNIDSNKLLLNKKIYYFLKFKIKQTHNFSLI